jgi:hypothetical protein
VEILKRAAANFAPGEYSPKLIYPLVRELADDQIDVAVACRVLPVSGAVITTGLAGRLSAPPGERVAIEAD